MDSAIKDVKFIDPRLDNQTTDQRQTTGAAVAGLYAGSPGHRMEPSMMEMDHAKFEADLDLPLDEGIRDYVLALREGGVETFESCQGGEGHPLAEPTVRFYGPLAAGFKAYGVALERGLPVSELRLVYPVNEYGLLTGPWWQMTFLRQAGKKEPAQP